MSRVLMIGAGGVATVAAFKIGRFYRVHDCQPPQGKMRQVGEVYPR